MEEIQGNKTLRLQHEYYSLVSAKFTVWIGSKTENEKIWKFFSLGGKKSAKDTAKEVAVAEEISTNNKKPNSLHQHKRKDPWRAFQKSATLLHPSQVQRCRNINQFQKVSVAE